jgi:hypothetical protein
MGTANIFKNSAKSNHWCCKLISLPIGATPVQLVKFYLYTVAGNNLVIPIVPAVPFVLASGRTSFRSFQLQVVPASGHFSSGRFSFRSFQLQVVFSLFSFPVVPVPSGPYLTYKWCSTLPIHYDISY